jgi:hypothetical protein
MPEAYRQSPDFFAKLAVGPELKGIMRSIAEDAKTIALEIVDSEHIRSDREHQHYADSFEVDTELIHWAGRYPGMRVTGVLKNTVGHAAAVEWGYRGRKEDEGVWDSAHRVLGRTLERLGDVIYGAPE